MNRSDALPKCVCVDCWEKTEDFHKFHRLVRNAQEEYLKQVVKFEIEIESESNPIEITEHPKFVEVITNCDEFNEFVDEDSIKPNNELDDVDQEIKPIEMADALYSEPTAVEGIEAFEEETGNFFSSIIRSCESLCQ